MSDENLDVHQAALCEVCNKRRAVTDCVICGEMCCRECAKAHLEEHHANGEC